MIMTVNEIWSRRGILEEFHHGALKENPSVRLVRVILAGVRINIDAVSIKESIVAEQEYWYVRVRHDSAMHVVSNAFET